MGNMSEGQQLAIAGADTAAAHADRVHGPWSEKAWEFFMQFAREHPGQTFMTEDVRAHAEIRKAVPPPPDNRAWGSIAMRASKAKLIRRVDYAPNKSPSCHASPKSVWVWVG